MLLLTEGRSQALLLLLLLLHLGLLGDDEQLHLQVLLLPVLGQPQPPVQTAVRLRLPRDGLETEHG